MRELLESKEYHQVTRLFKSEEAKAFLAYLLREEARCLNRLAVSNDLIELHRIQGSLQAIRHIRTLPQQIELSLKQLEANKEGKEQGGQDGTKMG